MNSALCIPAIPPAASHLRWSTAIVIAFAAVAGPTTGRIRAQDEPDLTTWAKVEGAAETRDYKEKIRAGGGIDAKSRAFLEQTALPQLALEGNRATIASLRKRLREFLLNDITEEKASDEANRIFLTFMEGLAAKDEEAAVVRINAMLLIGELQTSGSGGRKPWPGAVAPLATAAANTELPKEVRIAAAAGLSRQLDAAKASPEALGRIAKEIGPRLVAIVKEMAAAGSGPENDWLLSRCLSMLATLGPAVPDASAEIVKTLDAQQRSFDTRVRAATALAAVAGAGPQSNVQNAAAVIQTIEKLAVACLQQDADAAERLKLERLFGGEGGAGMGMSGMPGMSGPMPGSYVPPEAMGPTSGFGSPSDMGSPSGFGGPGGMPGQPPPEQLIPTEVCRRAAWRLASLANAILTADEKRGLAALLGDQKAAAKGLAENLRSAANTLDTNPVDASLLQALADLKPAPPPAAEGDAADTPEEPGDPPTEAAPKPAA